MEYRRKRGSFNAGRRVECSIALLAYLHEIARGRRDVSMIDFMPHEDEPVADINAIFKMLGGR